MTKTEIYDFIESIYQNKIEYNLQIDDFNYDIYFPELDTVIEYNSLHKHTEKFKDDNYHKDKTQNCNDKGIHIIHIWEDDWESDKLRLKTWLKGILGISKPKKVFGRKTEVKFIKSTEVKNFFDDYHIQGHGAATVCNCLYYDNMLISSCLFKIKNNGVDWDLTRYVTHPDYQVLGGFSKLITNFRKKYPGKIYTFADLAWVNPHSNVYARNGFINDKLLIPDYRYFWDKKRKHKFGFRHIHLKRKLKNYNPELTEKVNCFNDKVYRIYDCGKLRYVLE